MTATFRFAMLPSGSRQHSFSEEERENGMDGRFFAAGMIPLLFLVPCVAASPASAEPQALAVSPPYTSFQRTAAPAAPASPAKGCLPELLISPESIALDRERNKALLLVDIRPATAFEKLRIPGSLNFPLFAIKTKTFLKKYDLVLVDEGYRYARIEAECRQLRKAGFRLRILNGGLSAWDRNGGALEGDDFARKALNRLSPLDFYPEKDCGNWIVLDVSEREHPESASLFPRFVSIPYARDDAAFAARYERLLKIEMNTPCLRILLTDERGEHYGRLERVIRTTAFPDVFFLEGGREGYRKFGEGINASAKRLSAAPKKNRCGGVP
jgi:rhodanese-related sulfurtransferase